MSADPNTAVDEIAPDIYRISTWIPGITEHGFTFNQFPLTGDEPFLFHCGQRQLFPLVSDAITRVLPLEDLRWISFGHLEADECGAMNLMLASAPHAEVVHGGLALMLSLVDMCDRPPLAAPDDVLDIGGHRLKFIATPRRGSVHPHRTVPGVDRIRLRGTGTGGRVHLSRHRPDDESRTDT